MLYKLFSETSLILVIKFVTSSHDWRICEKGLLLSSKRYKAARFL